MSARKAAQAAPCTFEEVRDAVRRHWPAAAARHGIDGEDRDAPRPVVDGNFSVGFSVRLFGLPGMTPDMTKAGYAALDDMLDAVERDGFVITRHGNQWLHGRLVLGQRPEADTAAEA